MCLIHGNEWITRPSGAKCNVNIRKDVRFVVSNTKGVLKSGRAAVASSRRSALWHGKTKTRQQQLARRTTERREFCVKSRVLTSESFEAGWGLQGRAACSTLPRHTTHRWSSVSPASRLPHVSRTPGGLTHACEASSCSSSPSS